jgi:hypothetical protein
VGIKVVMDAQGNPTIVDDGQSTGAASVTPGLGVTKAEQNTYKVYMGRKSNSIFGSVMQAAPQGPRVGSDHTDDIQDADTAAASIYTWDKSTLQQWTDHLIKAGTIKPGQYTFQDLVGLWQDATDQAGKLHTLGGKNLTPWDVVDMNAEISGTKSGGPTSNTNKATSINEVDPATARSALDQTFSSLLGRDPSNAEREAFAAKVLQASKANPSVTTSVTNSSAANAAGNSTSSSTSTTSGGFSGDALSNAAEDAAKALPEYGSHQAATTAYNWLSAAIQGGGR